MVVVVVFVLVGWVGVTKFVCMFIRSSRFFNLEAFEAIFDVLVLHHCFVSVLPVFHLCFTSVTPTQDKTSRLSHFKWDKNRVGLLN